MEVLENRMVVDSEWPKPKQNNKSGWYSSWEDKFISDDEALEYALDQLQDDEDTKEEFADYAVDFIFTHKEVQRLFVDWCFRRWERREA